MYIAGPICYFVCKESLPCNTCTHVALKKEPDVYVILILVCHENNNLLTSLILSTTYKKTLLKITLKKNLKSYFDEAKNKSFYVGIEA